MQTALCNGDAINVNSVNGHANAQEQVHALHRSSPATTNHVIYLTFTLMLSMISPHQ
jgi:hypothetical protein